MAIPDLAHRAGQVGAGGAVADVLSDRDYAAGADLSELELDGSGYRWIRLTRTPAP